MIEHYLTDEYALLKRLDINRQYITYHFNSENNTKLYNRTEAYLTSVLDKKNDTTPLLPIFLR